MAKILVVDDEKNIRLILKEFLAREGHGVETAEDAIQAVDMLGRDAFDVVVTDIVLPQVNGVELLKQIRQASPFVQVILITGEPNVDTAAEALRAGAFDYQTKPIKRETITRVVANAVRVKQLEDERRRLEAENRRYQDHLEELVRERTRELEKTNQRLVEEMEQRNEAEKMLHHVALHDALTNLPNRTLFSDRVESAIARQKKHPSHSVAILLIDIDDFKNVNDSLGHNSGDQLIVELGSRLATCLEPETTLARFGGDEFAVLLEEVADRTICDRLVRRISGVSTQPFFVEGHQISISVSVGIAHLEGQSPVRSPHDLIRDADTALNHAKRLGKNRSSSFVPTMHEDALRRLSLEEEFRQALWRTELVPFYQPIIDMNSFEVSGFEVLLRWKHPERGIVSPGEFIPIAEDTGLIVQIGEWLLEKAWRQCEHWRQVCGRPLRMNVNVSPRQFSHPRFVETVRMLLEAVPLPPEELHLELTEGILIEHATSQAIFRQLKDLGVKICLDDFGTGYSSLSYLHNFPIDVLKIDRSFVKDIQENERSFEVVRAITALGSAYGLEVVAEGVETKEQAELLRTVHCQKAQGYYFGRPADSQITEELLRKR